MVNYYEILGIEPGCSSSDIKRSFRKRAKEIHPDLTSSKTASSEDQMRDLIKAYEVLSNPETRRDYDRCFTNHFSKVKFNYREFLRKRKHDPFSQSKLVFYDLLNSEYEEAIELYEHLGRSIESYDMMRYLGYEDFMDCMFLLAEAYEKKGELIKSCAMYKKIYIYEQERPYFHHFTDEIIERLRSIVCFKMITSLPPMTTIQYIQELINFNFSRKDNAFFYKKIAEIYCNLNQRELAVYYLNRGLELDQKLPGVKKLKEKIGYTEIPVY